MAKTLHRPEGLERQQQVIDVIDPEVLHQANWYKPCKQLEDFHNSPAWIRILVGGRGTGKSTSLCMDVIRHCYFNAGAKVLFVRKTEASQADSTIDTHSICYSNQGDLYRETDMSLFRSWNDGKTVRLPSKKAIEEYCRLDKTFKNKSERLAWLDGEGSRLCGFVEMRGLPNAGVSESKLRGFECSFLALVEADQISFNDYKLSLACLRWKGSDPETCDENGFIIDTCVVLDTNPPGPKHWIAQLEEDEQEKPERDREMEFWHLSTYENEHNLPPGYIKRQILLPYAKNPAMIERMLWGRYADAFEGTPVYHAYEIAKHEYRGLGWPKGATLICGMDVGNTNASIISALKTHAGHEYLWTMREIVLTDSDTDRQCIELLKVLAREFPWWNTQNEVCPQSLFFVDPAAAGHRVFTANGLTDALKVIQSHGIFPQYKMSERGLQPTIAIGNRLLNQYHIDDQGNTVHHFKIDPDRCPRLCNGLRGGYRFPSPGEVGYGSNKPLKGDLCDNLDHPCFVAGTIILTSRGEIPIEDVQVGDMALTRSGWRRILRAGRSSEGEMIWKLKSGNHEILATASHPIWTENQGWKSLASCITGDRITVGNQRSMKLNGHANTAEKNSWPTNMTTESIALEVAPICTGIMLPVYNITVEQDHEYFANGILVSNCDAWRYGYTSVLKLAKESYSDNMTAAPRGTGNIEPKRTI